MNDDSSPEDTPASKAASPKPEEALPKTELAAKLKRRRLIIPTIVAVLLILALTSAIAYRAFNQSRTTATTNTNQSSASTSAIPSVAPSPTPFTTSNPHKITLYTLSHDGQQKVVDLYQGSNDTQMSIKYFHGDEMYLVGDRTIDTYNLSNQQRVTVYKVADSNYKISNMSVNGKTFYVSIYKSVTEDDAYIRENDYIDIYNLATKTSVKKLGPYKPTLYGGMNYLLQTSKGDDVIDTFGGDSCAGFGTISLQTKSKTEKLLDIGAGCDVNPRYISSLGGQLVLMSVAKEISDEMPSSSKLSKLYTKDVYTNQEKTLYDFASQTLRQVGQQIDQSNNLLYLAFEGDQFWKIQIANQPHVDKFTINKELKLSENYWIIDGQTIYTQSQDGGGAQRHYTIKASDLTAGTVTTYSLTAPFDEKGVASYSMVGTWKNQPLLEYEFTSYE